MTPTKQPPGLPARFNMLLPEKKYKKNQLILDGYCLAEIQDFNTLITASQDHRTPVFALSDDQIGQVGTVLIQNQKKRTEFNKTFSDFAEKVIALID
jgi:hypothetical protein